MERTKKVFFDFILAGIIFILVLAVFTLSSCKHESPVYPNATDDSENNNGGGNNGGGNTGGTNCDPNLVYFEQQILPLIVSNCAQSGCHSNQDHAEGIALTNYGNIMSGGEVRPGNPNGSKLYEVITTSDHGDRMPPAPQAPLTSIQAGLISQWIQQGAQNNSCQNACDTTNVTYSGTISPIVQNYCVGCHSGGSPSGGIGMSTFTEVNSMALDGSLYGSVNHSAGYSPMPKGSNSLSTCQIDQIRIWIAAGSQNN